MCHGSGNRAKWVGMRELSDLLERAIAMEPDYLELVERKKPRKLRGKERKSIDLKFFLITNY